jgi:hypothetical protein
LSDIFTFDPSVLDSAPTFPTTFPQVGDLPDFTSLDLSNIFGPSTGSPLLPPVQNLPSTGSTGITGFLSDAANLASSIYKGEAQVAAAQSAGKVASAQTAAQLAAAKSAPLNALMLFGVLGVGFLLLRGHEDPGPPVQSVVSTTRRGR